MCLPLPCNTYTGLHGGCHMPGIAAFAVFEGNHQVWQNTLQPVSILYGCCHRHTTVQVIVGCTTSSVHWLAGTADALPLHAHALLGAESITSCLQSLILVSSSSICHCWWPCPIPSCNTGCTQGLL
jgi:hypothetical protein